MLIRNARLWPDGEHADDEHADGAPVDVRVAGDMITEVGPGLRRASGDAEVIDAEGAALLPGLHDHHIHLRALAAARASVRVGPPEVRTAAALRQALETADAAAREGGWLRCTGYHESVAGDLDRYALDRLLPGRRPVRVQHRTGALWILNSAAVDALGLDDRDRPGVPGVSGVERDDRGVPTGRLWRLDRWLAGRVPSAPPDLGAVSRDAAARGVTGFTDATPGASRGDIDAFADAVADGTIVQRLHCMAPPALTGGDRGEPPSLPRDESAVPVVAGTAMALSPRAAVGSAGAPVGSAGAVGPAGAMGRVVLGAVKVMLDDDALPTLDELAGRVRAAHAAGRPVAVHCVTGVQLVLTLAALDEAGRHPRDRIEHGAIIPAGLFPALRGLTIVTQPHFLAERGEQYAADVDPADRPDLWRLRSLLDAGLKVAAGSDAPFGGADPWQIAAKASRQPRFPRTERPVSPATILSLFFGEPGDPAAPRRVAPGSPADLVLLRVSPAEAVGRLGSAGAEPLVAATIAGGRRIF